MSQVVEITPNGRSYLVNLEGFSEVVIGGPLPEFGEDRFVHIYYHHACGNIIPCANVEEVYQQIKAALITEGS